MVIHATEEMSEIDGGPNGYISLNEKPSSATDGTTQNNEGRTTEG